MLENFHGWDNFDCFCYTAVALNCLDLIIDRYLFFDFDSFWFFSSLVSLLTQSAYLSFSLRGKRVSPRRKHSGSLFPKREPETREMCTSRCLMLSRLFKRVGLHLPLLSTRILSLNHSFAQHHFYLDNAVLFRYNVAKISSLVIDKMFCSHLHRLRLQFRTSSSTKSMFNVVR